jgi:predicted nucleic acid-binding protein
MKKRVYIETTIPSFYFETRPEPEMVARRNWTREWWDTQSRHYELVTSVAVVEELKKDPHPNQKKALSFIQDIPLVPITEEIDSIVDEYISHFVMPGDPRGDALHLALASYHHCHFLLTWNCRHLANANKFEHIRHMNAILGLYVPILATPAELMNENKEELDP